MKNNIFVLFLLLAIVCCDNKKVEINPKVDSYPMNIGTEWTYDRQIIIKKYESETSDKIIDVDIYNFNVRVWIDKDTLLNDTMHVKVFKAQEDNNNWTSNRYKFIDNEGLKNYAYSNAGAANAFAKKKGTLESSIYFDLSFVLHNEITIDDEIFYEATPRLDIKLPLYDNSSWTYLYPSETFVWHIDKEVIGTERLNLIGESFDCFKVYWNFLNSPASNSINETDWISDKGLIKRIIFSDRVFLRNDSGEYSAETAQVTETLILKELKIN